MHGYILLDKTFPYSVLKDGTSLLLDKTFPYSVLKDWTSFASLGVKSYVLKNNSENLIGVRF